MPKTTRRNRIIDHRIVKGRDLLPNPANWRMHPPDQRAATTAVLDRLGYVDELKAVDTPDGPMLMDGHLRAEIGADDDIPIAIVDLTPEEQTVFLATFDPLAAMAITDHPAFEALAETIASDDDVLMRLLEGVRQHETPLLLAQRPERDAEVTAAALDTAEMDDYKPFTKRGEVWRLGEHRLMCGDTTSAEDVEHLVAERADLLVTSPPYWTGQEYDEEPGLEAVRAFILSAVAAWARKIRRRVVVNTGSTNELKIGEKRSGVGVMLDWEWARAWEGNGWSLRNRRVWVKGGPLPHINPRSDLVDESCEMLMTFFRPGKNEGGQERTHQKWAQTGYWDDIPAVGKNMGSAEFPCPYPVELPSRFIQLYSESGDTVADPFVGSGTTIIAAENLGRRCYAMEIQPRYCDVVIQRWEAYTGAKAELLE